MEKISNSKTLAELPKLNTQFLRTQTDAFDSGLVRQIGPHAFTIWSAIKRYANFKTGQAWPGARKLAEITGFSTATIVKNIRILEHAKLLRIIESGSGTRSTCYVARERMDVFLGERVICTVVVDYVPERMSDQLQEIDGALQGRAYHPDAFTNCEIIPGDGFEWDAKSKSLQAIIPTEQLFKAVDKSVEKL